MSGFDIERDLDRALEVARHAAEAAGRAALRHFSPNVAVETKPDRSPVTAADREAEAVILSAIREAFPTHGILAEESGAAEGDPETRWIVDPLDGTRGFTRGGSFWGPLIGLEHRGQIIAGALGMPVHGDVFYAAKGRGCFRNGQRLSVSRIDQWSDATLSVGELQFLLKPPHHEGIVELIRTSASTRGFGDPAGVAMVLLGRAEAWVESGVKTWDLAPAKILLEEAGGRFSAFDGSGSIETGTAIGTNGRLHQHVLDTITSAIRKASPR